MVDCTWSKPENWPMLEMKPSKNRFCNYLDEDAIDEDILKA